MDPFTYLEQKFEYNFPETAGQHAMANLAENIIRVIGVNFITPSVPIYLPFSVFIPQV
jgi:hypothetical protein